jgi:hypothetical protein
MYIQRESHDSSPSTSVDQQEAILMGMSIYSGASATLTGAFTSMISPSMLGTSQGRGEDIIHQGSGYRCTGSGDIDAASREEYEAGQIVSKKSKKKKE